MTLVLPHLWFPKAPNSDDKQLSGHGVWLVNSLVGTEWHEREN